MANGYDLYSEFDMKKHKETYIHYLEIIIEEDGHIQYAIPSHQEKAISLACKAKGWTREELNSACPPEYYFDFLTWVLKQSGAISVWETFYMGVANDVQKEKLKELRRYGLYDGDI